MGWNTSINDYTAFETYASPIMSVGSSKSMGLEAGAYKVNENGQTYGTLNNAISDKGHPDLIGAVGVDGNKGYVYAKELFDNQVPASPEEAAALMTDREYIQGRLVNLYASNGVDVIGQFKVGGLIGVTIQEETLSRTYHEDGTFTTTYADGTETVVRWK